jgi:hypothetical protein
MIRHDVCAYQHFDEREQAKRQEQSGDPPAAQAALLLPLLA